MINKVLFLCFAMVINLSIAFGQNLLANAAFSQSQLELNNNAKLKFEKKDQELKNTYNAIIALLRKRESDDTTEERIEERIFVQTQEKWLEYRDACSDAYAKFYEGGSMSDLVIYDCKTRLTIDRLKELKLFQKDVLP